MPVLPVEHEYRAGGLACDKDPVIGRIVCQTVRLSQPPNVSGMNTVASNHCPEAAATATASNPIAAHRPRLLIVPPSGVADLNPPARALAWPQSATRSGRKERGRLAGRMACPPMVNCAAKIASCQ